MPLCKRESIKNKQENVVKLPYKKTPLLIDLWPLMLIVVRSSVPPISASSAVSREKDKHEQAFEANHLRFANLRSRGNVSSAC